MKYHFLLLILAIATFTSGCSTAISEYQTTERDQQTYKLPKGVSSLKNANNYVIETKGSGQFACINLGAKNGIKLGDKIDFFNIKLKNGKNFKIFFANGRVMELSENTSWVHVNNYQTAGVKENHYACKAADQSYSLGEKMLNPSLFFKKNKK